MEQNKFNKLNTQNSLDKNKIYSNYLNYNIHLGHDIKKWNPLMAPYIFAQQYNYHIINIIKSLKFLKLAGNVLKKALLNNKKILLVSTSKNLSTITAKYAKINDIYYINYRWLGGMLTNWSTLQNRINKLKFLEDQVLNNNFLNFSKKERLKKQKDLLKLQKYFNGIKNMVKIPDIVIFTNQLKEKLAIAECIMLGIPVISLVDSNCNPALIPYPIPANDNSLSSVEFILAYLTKYLNIN